MPPPALAAGCAGVPGRYNVSKYVIRSDTSGKRPESMLLQRTRHGPVSRWVWRLLRVLRSRRMSYPVVAAARSASEPRLQRPAAPQSCC